jgi:hypothetical protein
MRQLNFPPREIPLGGYPVNAIFHNREQIEWAAVRLYCVPTDNRDALLSLGFERMYPQVASGYESHLWARSIDSDYNAGTMKKGRKLVMQRAFLY